MASKLRRLQLKRNMTGLRYGLAEAATEQYALCAHTHTSSS